MSALPEAEREPLSSLNRHLAGLRGVGTSYHVAVTFPGFEAHYAACFTWDGLHSLIPGEQVPVELRCQRSGCRQRWPK